MSLALDLSRGLKSAASASNLMMKNFALGRATGGDENDFVLRGDGYHGDLRVVNLEFPDLANHPELAESKRVPGPIRAILRDYAPLGTADIHANFAADENPFDPAGGYQVRFEGAVELTGPS